MPQLCIHRFSVAGLTVLLCCSLLSASASAQVKDKEKDKDKAKVEPAKPAPKTWREAGTPLHAAAFDGDVAAAKKLLAAKDVDVNPRLKFRIFNDYTPLHMAAYEGHAKIVDLLIARKAELNLIDSKEKRTPLHIAAAYGRIDVVRALIKAGADLNLKDKNKNTALKLASEKAIIAELKKAGAVGE
jgi:hypothetical protein